MVQDEVEQFATDMSSTRKRDREGDRGMGREKKHFMIKYNHIDANIEHKPESQIHSLHTKE
jgi:hypothetical protein